MLLELGGRMSDKLSETFRQISIQWNLWHNVCKGTKFCIFYCSSSWNKNVCWSSFTCYIDESQLWIEIELSQDSSRLVNNIRIASLLAFSIFYYLSFITNEKIWICFHIKINISILRTQQKHVNFGVSL